MDIHLMLTKFAFKVLYSYSIKRFLLKVYKLIKGTIQGFHWFIQSDYQSFVVIQGEVSVLFQHSDFCSYSEYISC